MKQTIGNLKTNLRIELSETRLYISFWGDRVRITKEYDDLLLDEITPAVINWSTWGSTSPDMAQIFADWLNIAITAARNLNAYIITQADFQRVSLEAWPYGSSGQEKELFMIGEVKNKIIIGYPPDWIKS